METGKGKRDVEWSGKTATSFYSIKSTKKRPQTPHFSHKSMLKQGLKVQN